MHSLTDSLKIHLWHWKQALVGPVVGIAVLLWGQTTGRPLPWGWFVACVLGGLASQFWSELKKERETKRNGPVTATDWKDLATRFQRIPAAYVRAELYSETLDWNGQTVGERWEVRNNLDIGQFASQCEALCKLAGAMLMKSQKIVLSEKVQSRSDDLYRWLYFLAEKNGVAKLRGEGKIVVRHEAKENWVKEIAQLTSVSANACVECEAKEL